MTETSEMDHKDDIRINELVRASGAYGCIECGKCVAVCPMPGMYHNFSIEMSPRGLIKKARMAPQILEDESIWYCTECNGGTDICPEGVSCRDLIRGLRGLALAEGRVKAPERCSLCGAVYGPVAVFKYLDDKLKGIPSKYLSICPSCRRMQYMRRNA